MPTLIRKEIGLQDVEHALADQLGSGYRVNVTSDTSLRVYRNPVIWATVHVSWPGGGTAIRVRPGGFVLVMLLNVLYTVPKVRAALDRGLGTSGV
jgi:hypothetical protein